MGEAADRMKEAEDFLQAAKNKPGLLFSWCFNTSSFLMLIFVGCAHGSLWWIDRELQEKKKYMPTAKGLLFFSFPLKKFILCVLTIENRRNPQVSGPLVISKNYEQAKNKINNKKIHLFFF